MLNNKTRKKAKEKLSKNEKKGWLFNHLFKALTKKLSDHDEEVARKADSYISEITASFSSSRKEKSAEEKKSIEILYHVHQSILTTINAISNRKFLISSVHITILTIGLTGFGFLLNKFPNQIPLDIKIFIIIPYLAILLVCYNWFSGIRAYSTLNTVLILYLKNLETTENLPTKPINILLSTMRHLQSPYNLSVYDAFLPITFAVLYTCVYFIMLSS